MTLRFSRRFHAALLGAASLPPLVFAQTTVTTPTKEEVEALTLSPFVVSESKDNGYQANDTLAGTRLRTPLRDIAASISVVTPQLLEDTASNNLLDILVYTAGTEVAGVGGNFSGSNNNSNPSFEEARNSPVPVTRLRGLAAADTTRNFFPTVVPLDGYNTAGLTINRGANAVLFGLGSPAGIIETSTANAELRNRARAVVSASSYGSFRESIDLERVLIEKKLSLRVMGVNDNQKFEQDFAYRDVKRLYGAVAYKPFRNTTLRLNGEKGTQNQQLPRPNPPIDGLTSWYTYFKQTRPEAIYTAANSVAKQNFERLNNLDAAMAFTTGLNNPSAFYSDASNTSPGGMLIAIPSWANTPATDPAGVTLYRMLGVRQTVDARNFAFRNPPTNGVMDPVRNNTFSLNDMVLDLRLPQACALRAQRLQQSQAGDGEPCGRAALPWGRCRCGSSV